MPYSVFNKYCVVIRNLKAEEMLDAMNVSAYPKTKKSQMTKFRNSILKETRKGLTSNSGKSVKDLALEAVRKMGIGC